jgi:hypothetical protein
LNIFNAFPMEKYPNFVERGQCITGHIVGN